LSTKFFKSQSDFIANRLLDTVGEGEGGANRIKRVTLKHMLRFGKKDNGNLLNDSGNSNLAFCDNLEGWEVRGRLIREGTYVYYG